MQEISIVKSILKYLNSQPDCKAIKTHGGIYGAGQADITGCYKGRRIEIEVKRPGYEPTRLQAAILEQWRAAGALCGCAHSLDEAKEILKGWNDFGTR